MRRHRSDKNSSRIVDILSQCGFFYIDTSQVGRGFTDGVVGYGGETFLVEIKNGDSPFGWKFTEDQKEFRNRWNGGEIVTLDTEEAAITWIQKVRKRKGQVQNIMSRQNYLDPGQNSRAKAEALFGKK